MDRSIIIEGVDKEWRITKISSKWDSSLNADYVNQYVQYLADRRLEELGLRNIITH